MKSYKKHEVELINIQLSEYCELVTTSYEIDSPSEGGSAGGATGGMQQGSGIDDL